MKYSRLFTAALGVSILASAARAQSRLAPVAVNAAHFTVAPAAAPSSLSLAPSLSAAAGVFVTNAPALLAAPDAAPAAASAEVVQAPVASKTDIAAAPVVQARMTAMTSQSADRVLPEAVQFGDSIQAAASHGVPGAALNAFYDQSSRRDSPEPVAVTRALAASDGPALGAASGRVSAASTETPAPRPSIAHDAASWAITRKGIAPVAIGLFAGYASESAHVGAAAAFGLLGLTLIGSGVTALARAVLKANTAKSPERYAPGYCSMLLRFGLLIHGAIMTVGGLLAALSGGSALLLAMGLPVFTLSLITAVPMFTRPQNPAPDFPDIGGPIALLAIGASLFSAINIAVMTVDPSRIATGPWILPGFFGMLALSFTATSWLTPDESDTSASARTWARAIMGIGSIAMIASIIYFGGSAAGIMAAYGIGASAVILAGAYLSRLITWTQRAIARLLGKIPAAPKGPGVGEILRDALSRRQLVWGGLAVGAAFAFAAFALSLAGVTAGWLQLAYLLPLVGSTAGYLLSLPGKRA